MVDLELTPQVAFRYMLEEMFRDRDLSPTEQAVIHEVKQRLQIGPDEVQRPVTLTGEGGGVR